MVLVGLVLATVSTAQAEIAEPLEFRITIKRHADGALQAAVRVHEWDQICVGSRNQRYDTLWKSVIVSSTISLQIGCTTWTSEHRRQPEPSFNVTYRIYIARWT